MLTASVHAWVAYRLGARPVTLVAFMLSPPVLHGYLTGNIDPGDPWIVDLGGGALLHIQLIVVDAAR